MLNQYTFNNLDAYNKQAYSWATKEFNLIKDTQTISELNIDILSFVFTMIYNHFLHILGYSEGDVEAWLQDFFKKENIKTEWDIMLKYRDIVSNELFSVYENNNTRVYNNLFGSLEREFENEYGEKPIISTVNNEVNINYKKEEIMSFVVNRFKW